MTTGIRRLLIANRGEIAVRIARACRELGITSVAVFSEADRGSLHVRTADAAHPIGPGPAAESYLRVDRLLEVARSEGCDAVHPGYGFLSERAEFALACRSAGLAFVGPDVATLEGLGDKLHARRSAEAAGVPVVPGTSTSVSPGGPDPAGAENLARAAEAIGFPLLVKAAAGGGGRGMRRVDDTASLVAAIRAASGEALASFGDGAVYLERLIVGGRHVEVQLLGDELGDVVSLGERDCSIQRRHQKLVEESPAPGLSRDTRQSLHDAAVRVARQVGLRNAATAEFLYHAETGEYWFLEVNARLQVEHGLTELITGLDLVHEQLRISAGHPLTESVQLASQRALDPAAHAFEARISAEDPAESFAPSPGRVGEWHEPGGPGVRVDAGVEAGAPVPPHYDPLLAKLMVVAPDRSTALARMRRALGELRVTGVQTTLPFHRWLFAQEEFAQASFDTDHVTRHWEPGPIRAAAALRAAEAAARAGQNTAARLRGQEIPASNGWGRAAHVEAVDRW